MRPVPPDAAGVVEIPGPWQHRYIAARGARFHVVDAAPPGGADVARPTVVLLHGFPQFWWAWRHQLAALPRAGFRAVAIDLRGAGGSDKPPRGYGIPSLTADVDAVIRSLGLAGAVVVGHSWGGWIAWAMPALAPQSTRAIAVVATAHPLRSFAGAAHPHTAAGLRRTLFFQTPLLPERALASGNLVEQVLREASGTPGWPDDATVDLYARAQRIPSTARSSMETYRWALLSRFRRDGRHFAAALREPITVPVLHLHGDRDQHSPARHAAGSRHRVSTDYRYVEIAGGHFLAEENPEAVTAHLLAWLRQL